MTLLAFLVLPKTIISITEMSKSYMIYQRGVQPHSRVLCNAENGLKQGFFFPPFLCTGMDFQFGEPSLILLFKLNIREYEVCRERRNTERAVTQTFWPLVVAVLSSLASV